MGELVLYVHDLRSSGVVRNAIVLAGHLAQCHEVTLVAGYGQGLFRSIAANQRFALHVLAETPPGRRPRAAAALRLRRWLARRPGAVLLSVGNHGHPSAWAAVQGLHEIRRIYRISNGVSRDDGVRSLLRRGWMTLLVRDADRIALVGGAFRDVPPFAAAIASGRAVEIPTGLDMANARMLATAPSPHPWLDEPVPTVITIGRLRPQKNIDLLIAATGLARRTRRLRLIVIGEGTDAERRRLTALAATAGLGEDFMLGGETDNVFAWLARAGCFALASRWEGSSLSLIESMAVATPVVVSRSAGDAALVLDDGRYGLLFDGRDPAALAEGLLAQTSAAAVRPGDRAEAYSLEAMCAAYERLVASVLA